MSFPVHWIWLKLSTILQVFKVQKEKTLPADVCNVFLWKNL